MADYTSSARPEWYNKFRDKIKTVEIEEGVTAIGAYTFQKHGNLKQIDLPNTLQKIGSSAFASCTALTEIELPASVTSVESYAFYGTGLEKITFLSKTTKIKDATQTISESATIYGYAGSTAEAYANKYGRTFEVLK